MKTKTQIKDRISNIDSFIQSHKKELDLHLGEIFDTDQIEFRVRRIKSLREHKALLEWVLSES